MKITEKKIKIKDLYKGFTNLEEEGVTAYDGKLDVRPKYQRNFVYDDKHQKAVINTITKGLPLNVMYWVKADDKYELLDGQQRTMSICNYLHGDFNFNDKYFENLPQNKKDEINNYEIHVYVCEGNDEERLEWFEIINTAGVKLEPQELRNANYTGPWLSDAKVFFSKKNDSPAEAIFGDWMVGDPNRQDYLEKALEWIVEAKNIEGKDKIAAYMAQHQNDSKKTIDVAGNTIETSAWELIEYFNKVVEWTKKVFGEKAIKIQKGLNWGHLYNEYSSNNYSDNKIKQIQSQVKDLMNDEEVTNYKGIYEYVLSGDVKYLSIREFDKKQRMKMYNQQNHRCAICGCEFEIEDMPAHHIVPYTAGGKTEESNGVMLCKDCHSKYHAGAYKNLDLKQRKQDLMDGKKLSPAEENK